MTREEAVGALERLGARRAVEVEEMPEAFQGVVREMEERQATDPVESTLTIEVLRAAIEKLRREVAPGPVPRIFTIGPGDRAFREMEAFPRERVAAAFMVPSSFQADYAYAISHVTAPEGDLPSLEWDPKVPGETVYQSIDDAVDGLNAGIEEIEEMIQEEKTKETRR